MRYDYDDSYPKYVSVEERKKVAKNTVKKLSAKSKLSPIAVKEHRKISTSFWGQSWCRNLEAYETYAHRLSRGRTYVRAGSVIDLKIVGGKVTAKVMGTELYNVEVMLIPLKAKRWEKFLSLCTGEVTSLLDLFAGKLPSKIVTLATDKTLGIFPTPKEIHFQCTCPDYADMCKHIAATLYGIGVRFDEDANLFFTLRGVNPQDFVSHAQKELQEISRPVNHPEDLGALFNIEIEG